MSFKVTNNALSEVTLTALVSGRRVRLGTVRPNRTEVYVIDIRGTEPVALEVRMLGGGTCTTGREAVSSGHQIVSIIPASLSMMPGCR